MPCRSDSTWEEVRHRCSIEACDRAGVSHCHCTSLLTASDIGNVVCSVSWIRMADTLNTRVTSCLYCKIIVVTDIALKYFLERSTIFFANYEPDQVPSGVLRFHQVKIGILSLVVLCSLYVPKIIKFYRLSQFCYKQK